TEAQSGVGDKLDEFSPCPNDYQRSECRIAARRHKKLKPSWDHWLNFDPTFAERFGLRLQRVLQGCEGFGDLITLRQPELHEAKFRLVNRHRGHPLKRHRVAYLFRNSARFRRTVRSTGPDKADLTTQSCLQLRYRHLTL